MIVASIIYPFQKIVRKSGASNGERAIGVFRFVFAAPLTLSFILHAF